MLTMVLQLVTVMDAVSTPHVYEGWSGQQVARPKVGWTSESIRTAICKPNTVCDECWYKKLTIVFVPSDRPVEREWYVPHMLPG